MDNTPEETEYNTENNTRHETESNTCHEANYNTNLEVETNTPHEAECNTRQEAENNTDQQPENHTIEQPEYNFTNSNSGLQSVQVENIWDAPDTEDEFTSPACPLVRSRSMIPDTVRLNYPPTSTSLMQENFSQHLVTTQVPDNQFSVADTQSSVVDTQYSVADNRSSAAETQFSGVDTHFLVADTLSSVADTLSSVADTQSSVAGTLFSVPGTSFQTTENSLHTNSPLPGASFQDPDILSQVQGTFSRVTGIRLQQPLESSHVSSGRLEQQERCTGQIPKPVFHSSQSSSLAGTHFKQPANPPAATSPLNQPFPTNQQPPKTPTRNIPANPGTGTGTSITRPATPSPRTSITRPAPPSPRTSITRPATPSPRTPITRPATPSSRTPVKQSWPRSPFPSTPGLTSRSKRTVVSTLSAPHLQREKKLVLYPSDLVDTFKAGSAANTAKNKETGALLAGCFSYERNAWIVTHLIYPKQIGTATYYTEIPGNNYWAYLIQNNLTQLGSIHTHPNFSSFMSCVDLHMHAGIQRYENSAVAFVYSPLHETAPIFSINDLGLGILLSCPATEQDKAHPHGQPDDSLYDNATHTRRDPNLALSVMDCRDSPQPVQHKHQRRQVRKNISPSS